MSTLQNRISPEIIIDAYMQGYFPMADPDDGRIYWHNPDPRSIIPINKIKMPRSLRKDLKNENFTYKINTRFPDVIINCAAREDTWINDDIIANYIFLNKFGFVHSVETYLGNELVGGLYGVHLGAGFFGESMFSLVSNASKAAFYYLTDILKKQGFLLLDSQYLNEHTQMLGAVEIPKNQYLRLLQIALNFKCEFAE